MPTNEERIAELYTTLEFLQNEYGYNPDIERTIKKLESEIGLLERLIVQEEKWRVAG